MSVVMFQDIFIYPNNQSYSISLGIHKNVFGGLFLWDLIKISQGDYESISETDTAMNCSKMKTLERKQGIRDNCNFWEH